MSLLLFGDPHFANRQAFAKTGKLEFAGCNSRFHEIAYAFRRAVDYAVKSDTEALVILGDIFHDRGVVEVAVFNAVYTLLEEAKERGLKVVLFPGNHDYVDMHARGDATLHSIFSFGTVATVVSKSASFETDSFSCSIVPFTPLADKTIASAEKRYAKKKGTTKANLLLLHHSLDGAVTGPHEWVMPSRLKVDDLPPFDLIVSGHYHKHQSIDGKNNFIYAGAPLQHDRGEREYTPGFVIVHADGKLKHLQNNLSPKFVDITVSEESEIPKDTGDYLTVHWQGEEREGRKLREHVNGIVEVTPKSAKQAARSDITSRDSVRDMLQKYVKVKLSKDDPAYLETGTKLFGLEG